MDGDDDGTGRFLKSGLEAFVPDDAVELRIVMVGAFVVGMETAAEGMTPADRLKLSQSASPLNIAAPWKRLSSMGPLLVARIPALVPSLLAPGQRIEGISSPRGRSLTRPEWAPVEGSYR